MKIALISHIGKERAFQATRDIVEWLTARGVEVALESRTAEWVGAEELQAPPAHADLAVVLGGDGAFLAAARLFAESGVPILGVNVGHLGFLTEVELSDVYGALERVVSGDYTTECRSMVEARVRRAGKEIGRYSGLNDIVVTKGAFARIIRLETYVGRDYLGTYPADGMIVASPTGSTGYSLSAGGPIVNPRVDTVIVTPICPHTLYARSVLISGDEHVRIVVHASHEDVMLTVDGQVGFRLADNDEIEAGKSPYKAHLVRLTGRSFYEVLRSKLSEGTY